jgi:hypothetical protein
MSTNTGQDRRAHPAHEPKQSMSNANADCRQPTDAVTTGTAATRRPSSGSAW